MLQDAPRLVPLPVILIVRAVVEPIAGRNVSQVVIAVVPARQDKGQTREAIRTKNKGGVLYA